jgi:hypothetical protein
MSLGKDEMLVIGADQRGFDERGRFVEASEMLFFVDITPVAVETEAHGG